MNHSHFTSAVAQQHQRHLADIARLVRHADDLRPATPRRRPALPRLRRRPVMHLVPSATWHHV